MGQIQTNLLAKEITLEATITRADGHVEELGKIAHWHKNPLKRWYYERKVRK